MKKMKDTLTRAFYRLSGGRPMTFITFAFTDVVSGKPVNYYQDRHKQKYWMANGRWDKFRAETKKNQSSLTHRY
jgi:hypothetical protein